MTWIALLFIAHMPSTKNKKIAYEKTVMDMYNVY